MDAKLKQFLDAAEILGPSRRVEDADGAQLYTCYSAPPTARVRPHVIEPFDRQGRSEAKMNYAYDRGEHRTKHCWSHPHAGFVPSVRGPIGKCSNRLTDALALELLNQGLPFRQNPDSPHPDAIYNIFEGVPYVAVKTVEGISFHGYPHRGRMPERIRQALESRAESSGHAREFRRWMKDYGVAR